jgi:hypothetical protein
MTVGCVAEFVTAHLFLLPSPHDGTVDFGDFKVNKEGMDFKPSPRRIRTPSGDKAQPPERLKVRPCCQACPAGCLLCGLLADVVSNVAAVPLCYGPLPVQVALKDLKRVKVIGKGVSGRVEQVQHLPTGKVFALKVCRAGPVPSLV